MFWWPHVKRTHWVTSDCGLKKEINIHLFTIIILSFILYREVSQVGKIFDEKLRFTIPLLTRGIDKIGVHRYKKVSALFAGDALVVEINSECFDDRTSACWKCNDCTRWGNGLGKTYQGKLGTLETKPGKLGENRLNFYNRQTVREICWKWFAPGAKLNRKA